MAMKHGGQSISSNSNTGISRSFLLCFSTLISSLNVCYSIALRDACFVSLWLSRKWFTELHSVSLFLRSFYGLCFVAIVGLILSLVTQFQSQSKHATAGARIIRPRPPSVQPYATPTASYICIIRMTVISVNQHSTDQWLSTEAEFIPCWSRLIIIDCDSCLVTLPGSWWTADEDASTAARFMLRVRQGRSAYMIVRRQSPRSRHKHRTNENPVERLSATRH